MSTLAVAVVRRDAQLMAKREVLGCKANVRTEQEAYEAYKLDHPRRLGGTLAMTTNRKPLYNRQYGEFDRINCPLLR